MLLDTAVKRQLARSIALQLALLVCNVLRIVWTVAVFVSHWTMRALWTISQNVVIVGFGFAVGFSVTWRRR